MSFTISNSKDLKINKKRVKKKKSKLSKGINYLPHLRIVRLRGSWFVLDTNKNKMIYKFSYRCDDHNNYC
ncbi:hypothetical protein CISIN_1g035257mg [Citrus sinensis]|uniref:Uncharacterized protein n=1 Tax=Citrus sinensis TaxID=2711 RepID=A0A067FWQ2_CITSI|nr:hypothetical protein CISIN_1g035257mg [Citrus sinensis]